MQCKAQTLPSAAPPATAAVMGGGAETATRYPSPTPSQTRSRTGRLSRRLSLMLRRKHEERNSPGWEQLIPHPHPKQTFWLDRAEMHAVPLSPSLSSSRLSLTLYAHRTRCSGCLIPGMSDKTASSAQHHHCRNSSSLPRGPPALLVTMATRGGDARCCLLPQRTVSPMPLS